LILDWTDHLQLLRSQVPGIFSRSCTGMSHTRQLVEDGWLTDWQARHVTGMQAPKGMAEQSFLQRRGLLRDTMSVIRTETS
jgi:hypothetical protein